MIEGLGHAGEIRDMDQMQWEDGKAQEAWEKPPAEDHGKVPVQDPAVPAATGKQ